MRKEARILPNERLRQERQRRGWSREYVAEQIGIADPKTIGRWERGVAFPSSHFRQRLCTLFDTLAENLGLFKEGRIFLSEAALRAQWERTAPATFPVYDPIIPLPYTEPCGLIGRDELLLHLKQRLCTCKHFALAALNGIPGVGKTALAVELAYDGEIQQRFSDGILWVGMGPQPNVPGQLGRWGALLGLTAAEMENLTSKEAWARAIRAAIGSRRMLLVIDDAWKIEDALAFKIGGPNCAYLLTTRIPSVALHFANDGALVVRELDEDDSLQLLAQFAPEVITNEPGTARTLVQSVGGLPLALTLMGKYLQSQAYGGQARRLRLALERLRHIEGRLQLTALRSPLDSHAALPEGAPLSLAAIIEISYRQLDAATQDALSQLSVFPAKPHSFSEEASLAVSGASAETLDALVDVGLLECTAQVRYTFHQTIADYARTKLTDTRADECLVEYFIHYMQFYATDYDALEQEIDNNLAALQLAFERGMYSCLVRGIIVLFPFLQACGLYELAVFHLKRSSQVVHLLGDSAHLAKMLANLEEMLYSSLEATYS